MAKAGENHERGELSPEQREAEAFRRRRRGRSIALAIALAALVALFYAVTIAKMGPGVLDRPL
jgi:ferric-dicitrate binding protein FerR (iron transport regulator)